MYPVSAGEPREKLRRRSFSVPRRLVGGPEQADEVVVQAVAGSSPVAHPKESSANAARGAVGEVRSSRPLDMHVERVFIQPALFVLAVTAPRVSRRRGYGT
jgi:hypothetical protein